MIPIAWFSLAGCAAGPRVGSLAKQGSHRVTSPNWNRVTVTPTANFSNGLPSFCSALSRACGAAAGLDRYVSRKLVGLVTQGKDLRPLDVIIEHTCGLDIEHVIHHFTEYPGRFIGSGGHARRAWSEDNTWVCTVADQETFHLRGEEL